MKDRFIPLHRFREWGASPVRFREDIPLPGTPRAAFCPFPKPPPPGVGARNTWPALRTLAMERYLLRLSLSS